MKIERDDESTSFEARPWGGQQRLIPLAHRFARDPNATPAEPAQVVRPVKPAARPGPRQVASGTIAPHRLARASSNAPTIARAAQQPVAAPTVALKVPQHDAAPTVALRIPQPDGVPTVALKVPQLDAAPTVALRTPEPPPTIIIAAQALRTDTQAALPTDVEVAAIPSLQGSAYISAPVAPSAMPVMPGAVPAFSVKYGCMVSGFVMPHIPRIAQKLVDATVAVPRRHLSRRSIIAAPIGAALAGVVIAILCLAHPSVAAEPPTGAAFHRMSTVVSMPVVAAAVPTPVAAPQEAAVAAPQPAPIAALPASTPAARPRSHSSHHRPRKIIAGDASTPLGNLHDDLMVP